MELRFRDKPEAMVSDRLGDTVCYAELCSLIRRTCEAKEYHLIEKLADEIYRITRELTGSAAAVGVRVHKVRPPIENLKGGSIFRCGDFAW